MNLSDLPEVCISAFNLTYHPVYRTSVFVHFTFSTSSMFPLLYFIIFKLFKTTFHGNLKFLLVTYFISVFLFSVVFAVISAIQILIPFMSNYPCGLLISNSYLKTGNTLVSFFMTLSTFFPISITIERFIAMKTAKSYEKQKVIFGPVLAIFIFLLDSIIIYLIYKPEKFDDGSISLVFFPKTLAPKMFTFFCTMLVLNSINFIFNSFLLRQNNKIKNSTSSLTTKYQREEVYQSTKFAIFVIFCHFSLFGTYVIGIIVLRYFGDTVIKVPTNLVAARGAYTTMITLYNLVVGSVAVYFNRRLKLKKTIEIAGTVRIEATGNVGAQNYDNAILNVWNTVSTRN